MTIYWWCLELGCSEQGEGDAAAARHTRDTRHGTLTSSRPRPPAERPLTTKEAAEQLDVPAKTISLWRTRGLVTPMGIIGRGRGVPVYGRTQLQPLADAYHRRRTRLRRSAQTLAEEDR